MNFEQFYEQHFQFVYRTAFSYLYDKTLVEDVVQKVFSAAFVKYEELQRHTNIEGWLVITVRNQSTKAARKQLRSESSSVVWEDDTGLLELLPLDFPAEYKSILIDRYEKQYPIALIALRHHISVNAVYIRLTRSRAKLKGILLKEKGDATGIYPQIGGESHEKGT